MDGKYQCRHYAEIFTAARRNSYKDITCYLENYILYRITMF